MSRQFLLQVLLAASLVVISESQATARVISDSLVRNLNCSNLNVDSIYSSLGEDAFSEIRHNSIQNWGFSSGVGNLGVCWSLSATQRRTFYLARFNPDETSLTSSAPERAFRFLNMVRGSTPVEVQGQSKEIPLPETSYSVFSVQGENLQMDDALWSAILKGNGLSYPDVTARGFVADTQGDQVRRFFNPANVLMGMGNGARSAEENQNTYQQIIKNLDGRRLTLINLRAHRSAQHIAILKSYKKWDERWVEFQVYDSNYPQKNGQVFFDLRDNRFLAPFISNYLTGQQDGDTRALGVFIVDEDERVVLENAWLRHYADECRKSQ